jgi:putative ABC transport system permease protein
MSVLIEGKPVAPMGMSPFVSVTGISPDYLHVMRIPLASGRGFNDSDIHTSTPVAIVNQAFVGQFFPGEEVLGKRFRVPTPGPPAPWTTIVGVVADVRHLGLAESVSPEIYRPLSQGRIYTGVTFVIRTTEVESTSAALRKIITRLDPSQPVSDVLSMEQQLSASLAARRFNLIALGAFALLALILAAVGIFGVLSYSVAQRSHEIGVRMALGSDRARVLKLVLREAAWLSVAGSLCGIAGAAGLTRFMSSLLYHTSVFDPLTMITVAALLIGVGILAGFVPAHRASRVDPMIVLRAE